IAVPFIKEDMQSIQSIIGCKTISRLFFGFPCNKCSLIKTYCKIQHIQDKPAFKKIVYLTLYVINLYFIIIVNK
ncbi:hypothetical protein D7X33_46600, partial [Butyricicoccus sp. 1XD8-22]